MKENLLAIFLAIIITLIYSCSDNKKQKRMDRDVQKVFAGVQEVLETLLINQEYLEKSLNGIVNDQTYIGPQYLWLQDRDKIWENHFKLIEIHRQLTEKSAKLFESTILPKHMQKEKRQLYEEKEIIKLHVQVVDLMKQSKKIVKSHNFMKAKHRRT
jgi:hypothetical protein